VDEVAFGQVPVRAAGPPAVGQWPNSNVVSCQPQPNLVTAGTINLLKPSGHYMYRQFNIQQLYALPTLYFRVLYLSQNKQRLVPLTA